MFRANTLSLARVSLGMLVLANAIAADAAKSPDLAVMDVGIRWGVKIPLRDGVKLNATRYAAREVDAGNTTHCIFTLTPYISQSYHDRGLYFGANGYVFLTVDARGRGNSEGEFTPFLQETKDAHDVVEWLAKQDYCHGKVTMWGGSYAGYDQWVGAMNRPTGLETIVPVASPYPGVDFPMSDNMPYLYDMQWLTLVAGRASQDKLFGDSPFWTAINSKLYREHGAFNTLDSLVGMPSPTFQTWLKHPAQDDYWASYAPTAEQFAALKIPILSITGMYDGDQPGAFAFYNAHMKFGNSDAKRKHYLIIGPWDHPGTRTPQAQVGGLTFGAASLLDMNALHKSWYDWTLKNASKPEFLKDYVAYYVSGADQWRYAPTLAAVTSEMSPRYLSAAVNPSDVFAAGTMSSAQNVALSRSSYRYDPLDVSGAELANSTEEIGELVDQRGVLAAHGDALIFHSDVFSKATELSGFFKFKAWLAIDQPDTDIAVQIYEIKADGSSIALASDALRVRYRLSKAKETLATKGEIWQYDFDSFTFASREVAKGSRLRLVVSAINTPSAQKNYNSGGEVARETAKDARTVNVTVYHDAEHPSALYLPLGRAADVR